MKKHILIVLAVFYSSFSFSQEGDGLNNIVLDQMPSQTVEVVARVSIIIAIIEKKKLNNTNIQYSFLLALPLKSAYCISTL